MRILIFDEIQERGLFYTKICEDAHIAFDLIQNYNDFLQKRYEDYLAVLVRGKFSDEHFASSIRRQINERSQLIALSDSPLTVDQLHHLKEVEKIPFVLNQDIESYELKVIILFCKKETVGESEIYLTIKERFNKTLYGKLRAIEKHVDLVKETYSKEAFLTFQQAVLSLSVIAYAHDYFIVSHLCRGIVLEVQKWNAYKRRSKDDLRKLLQYFICRVEAGFQLNGMGEGMEMEVSENLQRMESQWIDVYLIDQPKEWERIQKWAQGCGINFSIMSPEAVLQQKTENSAKITLLCQGKEENTQQWILRFKELQKKIHTTLWGVIDFHGDLHARTEAMKAGVSFFLPKGISNQEFIDRLNVLLFALKKKKEGAKTLFIKSKEIEFLSLIQSSFAGLDYVCEHFREDELLFKEMEKRPPHLVILKEEAQNSEAIHLMHLIHADLRFKQLPVLIITDLKEKNTVEELRFGENEDWLIAPFSIPALQSKVVSALKRQKFNDDCQSHDPDTQVYTPIKFRDRFHPTSTSFTFALVEVDLDQISIRFGKEKYDEVLFQIGRNLNHFFAPNEQIVRWRENQFVLIFEEQEIQVEYLMKVFVQKMQKTGFAVNSAEATLYLAYALASYPTEGRSLNELYFAASEKLKKLKVKEKEKIAPSKRAEVMLIDPDEELLHLLEATLKEHTLDTCLAKNGNQALSILKSREGSQLPSLIVSERLLEDMDGIELISQFKTMFPDHKSTFWFLSVRSSEEDMLNGLRAGATDYLVKPFNLSLLIEKIYNSLKKEKEVSK